MRRIIQAVLATALANASVAGAQSTARDDRSEPTAASTRSEDLEEVIVTAQKREQRLQDVPISISVLGGEELDRSTVQGVSDALNRVPGVATTVAVQGGGTQLAVRGVTAGGPLFNGSSPIAYYLDSVPFGLVKNAITPDASVYDLRQVEVLRGPQGTLYGANAQNGVVRVLTNDAKLDSWEFKARTSGSNTESGGMNYRGDMAVNVPIVSDTVAARVVLGYEDLSGWIDRPNQKDANDTQLSNARFKLKAQPSESFSIDLSAWLSRQDYGAPPLSRDDGQHSSVESEQIETDYDAYSVTLTHESSAFTLTSMTSYLDFSNASSLDLAPLGLFMSLFTTLDADVLSEEIILASNGDTGWRWSVGAFYRDAEDRLRQNNLGGGPAFDYVNESTSYAGFGEIGRRFANDRWEWTVGGRYFHDEVTVQERINQGAPGDPLIDEVRTFHSTTPRVVLSWFATADLTAYGSYSQGFRSGFSQDPGVIRSFPLFPSLKPDKLHNYEIGAKADLQGGRISIDTAVYYIDWQDVQQTLTVPFNGTEVTALLNGEAASGFGADFGIVARPIEGLEVGINGSWNDLKMDSVVFSQGAVLFSEGDRLNLSPEYTAGAFADYVFSLGRRGLQGRFSASANYSAEQAQRTISLNTQFVTIGDPILLTDASLSVESSDRWSATLFVDNIADRRDPPLRDLNGVPDWATRVRPRTVGVQLEYRF